MNERIAKYTETTHAFGDNRPEPTPGEIQVIYQGDVPYAVDFVCPCGCGNTCFTPIGDPNDAGRHKWGFSRGSNGVTLHPSIRWTSGCKAHFNITDGATVFHTDSGK